jgi:hypothetical protein
LQVKKWLCHGQNLPAAIGQKIEKSKKSRVLL